MEKKIIYGLIFGIIIIAIISVLFYIFGRNNNKIKENFSSGEHTILANGIKSSLTGKNILNPVKIYVPWDFYKLYNYVSNDEQKYNVLYKDNKDYKKGELTYISENNWKLNKKNYTTDELTGIIISFEKNANDINIPMQYHNFKPTDSENNGSFATKNKGEGYLYGYILALTGDCFWTRKQVSDWCCEQNMPESCISLKENGQSCPKGDTSKECADITGCNKLDSFEDILNNKEGKHTEAMLQFLKAFYSFYDPAHELADKWNLEYGDFKDNTRLEVGTFVRVINQTKEKNLGIGEIKAINDDTVTIQFKDDIITGIPKKNIVIKGINTNYNYNKEEFSNGKRGADPMIKTFINIVDNEIKHIKKICNENCSNWNKSDYEESDVDYVNMSLHENLNGKEFKSDVVAALASQTPKGGCKYIKLAIANNDHFSYDAFYCYQIGHALAIRAAQGFLNPRSENTKSEIEDPKFLQTYCNSKIDSFYFALALEAASNHFLTDLFAGGHVRNNARIVRDGWYSGHQKTWIKGAGGLLVKGQHDEENFLGLNVRNAIGNYEGDGNYFKTFGDSSLLVFNNKTARLFCQKSIQSSMNEVLSVFYGNYQKCSNDDTDYCNYCLDPYKGRDFVGRPDVYTSGLTKPIYYCDSNKNCKSFETGTILHRCISKNSNTECKIESSQSDCESNNDCEFKKMACDNPDHIPNPINHCNDNNTWKNIYNNLTDCSTNETECCVKSQSLNKDFVTKYVRTKALGGKEIHDNLPSYNSCSNQSPPKNCLDLGPSNIWKYEGEVNCGNMADSKRKVTKCSWRPNQNHYTPQWDLSDSLNPPFERKKLDKANTNLWMRKTKNRMLPQGNEMIKSPNVITALAKLNPLDGPENLYCTERPEGNPTCHKDSDCPDSDPLPGGQPRFVCSDSGQCVPFKCKSFQSCIDNMDSDACYNSSYVK